MIIFFFFFFYCIYELAPKLSTMSDEWIAANKEYMKFQKMNPIFGKLLLLLDIYFFLIDTTNLLTFMLINLLSLCRCEPKRLRLFPKLCKINLNRLIHSLLT